MKKIITLMATLLGFGLSASEANQTFPPVPKWKPSFTVSVDTVLDRLRYYTNNEKDIAIFKNGTVVILPNNLSDTDAKKYALKTLSEIYRSHPDMNPLNMDDGNILVQYNHPAYNVVINDFVDKYIDNIKARHLDGLVTSEVLITPLGNNVFDEFGMKALYGRALMFMDAQQPKIVKIYRYK